MDIELRMQTSLPIAGTPQAALSQQVMDTALAMQPKPDGSAPTIADLSKVITVVNDDKAPKTSPGSVPLPSEAAAIVNKP